MPGEMCCVETLVPDVIYAQDNDGDTLLHTAIILKMLGLAMQFISKAQSYESLMIKNLQRQTPLHLAVLTNQLPAVWRLVIGGSKLDSCDKAGNTPLHIACRDGLEEIVQVLIQPVPLHELQQNTYDVCFQSIAKTSLIRNYDGLTCLHLAAINGHLNIVKMLLDSGIDINFPDGKSGKTALHLACISGANDLVELLLKYKTCDVNARTFDDITAFDIAHDRKNRLICLELAAAGGCCTHYEE